MILGSGLLQSGVPSFGTLAADSSDSTLFSGYTPNVAVAGPVSQRLYFGKAGGRWTTLWTDTSGALLRGDEAGTHAVTLASSGPEPFDTDTGIATDVLSGSVASGATFSHAADCLIEFTNTTLGSGSTKINFRQQDGNNRYEIVVWNNGTNFSLNTLIGGTQTTVATATSVLAPGDRILVVVEGSTVRGYTSGVLRWTYGSASNFATATNGNVSLALGAVISDLKTWPRELSGTAASILNKASG